MCSMFKNDLVKCIKRKTKRIENEIGGKKKTEQNINQWWYKHMEIEMYITRVTNRGCQLAEGRWY